MYLGDFKEDGDIFFKFTTRAFATGIPTALAGTPVLSVYKDEGGAATEKTTAETYFDLDVSHDSIAGWNNVRVDLAGDAFFATGADYAIVITTGTVDSVSVVGENIATFSIENRSMGQPAGATLAADIAAIKAETALIVADTDVIDDGTSGLVKIAQDVAAVLSDTGTDGVVVNAASLAADAVNEIVDQVWNEARSDHTTDGSTGQAMRKLLDIDVDDTTAANAGSGLGQIDDIQTDTGVIGAAGAGLTDLGGMATGMKNEVNAEVDTALDTTIAELSQGIPATTPTVRTALMLLYMALRNKLDVNTTASPDVLEVHNDAGTIIAKKNLTDDGTDYSEAKMASGA